jgi:hypothetical protein
MWEHIVYALIYSTIGYAVCYNAAVPKSEYWSQKVQLYSGVTMSSPVADVWGYYDDWDGCQILAAGANFITNKEKGMSSISHNEFVSTWAKKGPTFCRINDK